MDENKDNIEDEEFYKEQNEDYENEPILNLELEEDELIEEENNIELTENDDNATLQTD